MEEIEKRGINSTQRFIEATSNITFKEQGEFWLKSLLNRKRNPLERSSVNSRRYALDKWVYPQFGEKYLADVHNKALKDLVDRMAESLAPATIRDYVSWVKDVVGSALDENGEEKFPRKWNDEFIDAPPIGEQKQPAVASEGISRILSYARGQYQMLYALLAGCGPLRIGEALGLEIKHISTDFRTLQIVQKAKRADIQDYLKTPAGKRQVDLCSSLAVMLKDHVGARTNGLVFPNKVGKPLDQAKHQTAQPASDSETPRIANRRIQYLSPIQAYTLNQIQRLQKGTQTLLVWTRTGACLREIHKARPGARVSTHVGRTNRPGF